MHASGRAVSLGSASMPWQPREEKDSGLDSGESMKEIIGGVMGTVLMEGGLLDQMVGWDGAEPVGWAVENGRDGGT